MYDFYGFWNETKLVLSQRVFINALNLNTQILLSPLSSLQRSKLSYSFLFLMASPFVNLMSTTLSFMGILLRMSIWPNHQTSLIPHYHNMYVVTQSFIRSKVDNLSFVHWTQKLFIIIGFSNSHSDTSLFISCHDEVLIYFLVYVDDLILTGITTTMLQHVIAQLLAKFSIRDLRTINYFLSVEVVPTPQSLLLSQHWYIQDLLAKTVMLDAKAIQTPLSINSALSLTGGSNLSNATEYWHVLGSL